MNLPSRLELESQIFGIVKVMRDLYDKAESGLISTSFYQSSIQQKIHEIYLIEFICRKKNMDLDKIIHEMKLGEQFQDVIDKLRNSLLLKTPVGKSDDLNNGIIVGKKTSKKSTHPKDDMILPKTKKTSQSIKNADVVEYNTTNDTSHSIPSSTVSDSPEIISMEKLVSSSGSSNNANANVVVNSKSFNPITLAKISADITADFITIIDFFHLKLAEFGVIFDLSEKLKKNLILFPGMDEVAADLGMFFKEIMWLQLIDGTQKGVTKSKKGTDSGQIKIENGEILLKNDSGKIMKQIGYDQLGKNFELMYLKFKKNMIVQIGK